MRLERVPQDPAPVELPTMSERSVGVAVSETGVAVALIGESAFTVEDPGSKTVAEQLAEISRTVLKLLGHVETALMAETVGS